MTMHERVHEAGEAKLHGADDPRTAGDHSGEKEAIYSKALDPNSDWPEARVDGDKYNEAVKEWMPSPAAGDAAPSDKAATLSNKSNQGLHDEVSEINGEVGAFLQKGISPHGHAHRAGGATGYADRSQ